MGRLISISIQLARG